MIDWLAENKERQKKMQDLFDAAPELQNCPFCGGTAGYSTSYNTVDGDHSKILGGVWVSCGGCLCQVGRGGWDSMENDNGIFNNFIEAATAWNKRTS